MQFKGIDLCCPRCEGDLRRETTRGEEHLLCASCRRRFPVLYGIPDLRINPDPYIGIEADRAKGLELTAHFDQLGFRQLVEHYYAGTPVVPPKDAARFTRGLMAATSRARTALDDWEAASPGGPQPRARALLEIGCGTGPALLAAAARYRTVVGVDIAFRWLIIARKRLQEAGLDIPLVCACAEALPFRRQAFDTVVAESVLEHLHDRPAALRQCYRVLRTGGHLYVATPNQFSLGPDPHTGLWAGGMLPQSWVARHVQRQGGIPPKRSLLSVRTLRGSLDGGGFETLRVWAPAIPPAQRSIAGSVTRRLIDLYMTLRRLPVTRSLLLWVGPLIYAVARKVEPPAEAAA